MPESVANSHPSPELLRRFRSGALHGPEADAIRGHVETCAICRQNLREPTGGLGNAATGTFSPTSSPSADCVGTLPERVGRYRLEHEIARGGMGLVVRVTDEVFQRPLAMKIALGADRGSPDTQERFVREALLTGQLQHPGVPPVQEMGQLEDGRPYFIMKLIKGSDLRNLLCNRPTAGADLPRFVAIFGQICQTLGYAHSHGIIHRDLKPANIMVGAFGEVQVMDWGLAKLLTPDGRAELRERPVEKHEQPSTQFTVVTPNTLPQETVPGTVMGTSAYMPPEQARGEAETLDPRCDVFGLGGILCEVLTGKPPFAEKTSTENLRLSMKGDLSDAVARLDGCGSDAELVDLAKRCLAPDRADRPAHGGAVATAVAAYQAALQERMQQAQIDKAAALVKVREERKRRRVNLALAAALVVLVVGVSAGALWYQGEMARQEEDKIRQDADKYQQQEKLALRREYLNKEIAAAVTDAEQGRQDLLNRLAGQRTLNELLSDIDQWQRAGKEAQAAYRRARALADCCPELIEQPLAEHLRKLKDDLEADEENWKFGKACDDVRMAGSVWVKSAPKRVAQEYPGVFAGAGLDVEHGDSATIAARMKNSPIRLVYVAALDHWGTNVAQNKVLLARLYAITNEVDTDPWRKELRNAVLSRDYKQFQAVADKVDVKEHSPQTLAVLAGSLWKNDDRAMLLRKALTYHPRDFWLLNALGHVSTDPMEKVGCGRAALAIRPLSSVAHSQLAFALRHDKKNTAEAGKHFRKAIEISPDYAWGHFGLGNALHDQNDLEGAIKHLRIALDIDPNLARVHYNLAQCLYEKKDVAGAIHHYLKAIDLDPTMFQAHINLGIVLHDKNDVEGAIKQYLKGLEIDGNDAIGHYNLGNALIGKKNLEAAIKHYLKAVAIDPDHASAHYNLGHAYYAKKNLEAAIKHYLKAIKIDPDHAPAHNGIGNVLRDKRDLEGAIKYFRKARDIDPKSTVALVGLGNVTRDKNDFAGAIKYYRMALDINDNDAIAHVNLGGALGDKKDFEEAIKEFRKALDIEPKSTLALVGLGRCLYQKKEVEGAVKNLRTAIEIDANCAPAHDYLGAVRRDKNDVPGAIKHFRKAIESDENYARAHVNLGSALYAMKDLEGAIKHFRRAIEINPNEAFALARAHSSLGAVLRDKKDLVGAIKHGRKSIEINPDDAEAHNNLAAVLGETNDLEGAIRHLLKAIEIDPQLAQARSNPWRCLLWLHGRALLGKGQICGSPRGHAGVSQDISSRASEPKNRPGATSKLRPVVGPRQSSVGDIERRGAAKRCRQVGDIGQAVQVPETLLRRRRALLCRGRGKGPEACWRLENKHAL